MMLGLEPDVLHQAWTVVQVAAIAATAGWTSEKLLDTGVQSRGLPLLAGLFGLYVGPHVANLTSWPSGPVVAGYPLAAAFVGALMVCSFLKLANLATSGPRR